MTVLHVGPASLYPTIAAAMLDAQNNDTISLDPGYSNETATVTHTGMIVTGGAASTGIVLKLGVGIPTFTLRGTAPITVHDAVDGNGIVGNSGNNTIIVTNGADAVNGGQGVDRLVVDYRLATGAVTGDSTSGVAEAGGSRLVTITSGTFENFKILTGSGADTLTTGDGDDTIRSGDGASTVSAGQGANVVVGGSGADTVTTLDGGNLIRGGNGANTLTSGAGSDTISAGVGTDTVVAGGGNDRISLRGGADTLDSGAGVDRVLIDYSELTTAVNGAVTAGTLLSGYTGSVGDGAGNQVDFQGTEHFTIVTGSGNDTISVGGGNDVLIGGGGFDLLYGRAGRDQLQGGANADTLSGGSQRDSLSGQAGSDLLNGGLGNDTVTGGAGNDAFTFSTVLGSANIDRITDFTVPDDTMRLDDAVFAGIGPAGSTLAAGFFRIGAAAADGNDHIIYDDASGALFYDEDGVGGAAQVKFAQLETGLALSRADFEII